MKIRTPPARETLTLRDAAKIAGLSRDSFSRHALHLIPHQKVGNRYLISEKVLRDWLEKREGKAT